jgi:hypothetical protein
MEKNGGHDAMKPLEKNGGHDALKPLRSGANPTTFDFTTTSRLERFFAVEEHIFAFKTHKATRGVVNFLQRRR